MPSWGNSAVLKQVSITVTILCWRMATSYWYAGDGCASTEGCGTYRKIEIRHLSGCLRLNRHQRVTWQGRNRTAGKMRSNPGIRDRVFYVFNRISKLGTTSSDNDWMIWWVQFQDTIYKTSGLLGFYGGQIKQTTGRDRFGFRFCLYRKCERHGWEETPQFINEFNRYCANLANCLVSFGFLSTAMRRLMKIMCGFWLNREHHWLTSWLKIVGLRFHLLSSAILPKKTTQLFANLADDLPAIVRVETLWLQRDG